MFETFHTWFFSTVVQPALYQLGMMAYVDQVFDSTAWFLYGLIQIALLVVLVRPLESLIPAEDWPDRRGTGVDFLYTCINRLGLLVRFSFTIARPERAGIERRICAIIAQVWNWPIQHGGRDRVRCPASSGSGRTSPKQPKAVSVR